MSESVDLIRTWCGEFKQHCVRRLSKILSCDSLRERELDCFFLLFFFYSLFPFAQSVIDLLIH